MSEHLKSLKNRLLSRYYSLYGKCICSTAIKCFISGRENEKRLSMLKDKYNGERAFIIGNGPSLNKTDIRLLKNEITIGCNGLFLLFDYMGFLPTFYTVEDPLVADDRAKVINNIKGTTKIFPYDLRHRLKPDDDTIYVNFNRHYADFPEFSMDFKECVYWGGTVTYMNIQLAYYLGIREVYLIGMDHYYHNPTEADEQKGNVIKSHSDDINHFHPDYFGPGFRYHDPKVERMEIAYNRGKDFFENNGGCIYNATSGGNLEVFERLNFETLF